jgi:hypothetical protein
MGDGNFGDFDHAVTAIGREERLRGVSKWFFILLSVSAPCDGG